MTTLSLDRLPGRCDFGFDIRTQHGPSGLCACRDGSEWALFVAAVVESARDDRTVHLCDVRPKIRGRVAPKHIGSMFRRAKADGLLCDTGQREPSDDAAGRNTDKLDRIYELRAA